MSKELEALEVLKCGYKDEKKVCITRSCFDKNIGIIETALKDYQTLKIKYAELETEYCDKQRSMLKYDEEKQKKLKALKIIKEKEVNIPDLLDCIRNEKGDYIEDALKQYNMFQSTRWQLTKEEYDLLKEVFL